jgi:hypothetical protein
MMPVAASADDHHGEHNTGQHFRRDAERERREHLRQERERHERQEREARLRHERHDVRHDFHHREEARRLGADHGQKRGWRGHDLPPGQEKKNGR